MKIRLIIPIKSFRVYSKDKTHWHIVDLMNNGKLRCDCEAGTFNRFCRHKKIVSKRIEKHFYDL